MSDPKRPWGPDIFHLIDQHVGRRLKERRQALNMSRADLADYLQLPETILAAYESGELSIPVDDLYDGASFLEVRIEDLYKGLDKELQALGDDEASYRDSLTFKKAGS